MSSTSFGVYLTSGTTYPNLTQNGCCLDRKARTRPTGILSVESWHETLPKLHRGRIQAISNGLDPEIHNLYPEGLNPYPKEKLTRAMVKHVTSTLSKIDPWPERSVSCNGGPRGRQRQAARSQGGRTAVTPGL